MINLPIETIIQETILNLENQYTLIIQTSESFFMSQYIEALYVPAPKLKFNIKDLK